MAWLALEPEQKLSYQMEAMGDADLQSKYLEELLILEGRVPSWSHHYELPSVEHECIVIADRYQPLPTTQKRASSVLRE